MDLELIGKTYLITGASGGIGLSCSRLLLEEGANVVLHYNSNSSPVNKLVSEFDTEHAFPVQANLMKEGAIISMFSKIRQKYGRIDGLVNNAGIWPPKDTPIHDMEVDQFDTTISVNLRSAFLCTREFLKQLQELGGDDASIIFIGSTAGIFGEAGHIDYSVSKAGMLGMVLSLKNEITRIARHGRVNLISPGWVKTPMAEEGLEDKAMVTKVMQTTAMRKIANAEDVAHSIVYMLSDKVSGHISGQNIAITGGMEGRLLYQPHEIEW